eukprot:SAG25_NODE_26_length_21086_cov_21.643065_18_plen_311_part_00
MSRHSARFTRLPPQQLGSGGGSGSGGGNAALAADAWRRQRLVELAHSPRAGALRRARRAEAEARHKADAAAAARRRENRRKLAQATAAAAVAAVSPASRAPSTSAGAAASRSKPFFQRQMDWRDRVDSETASKKAAAQERKLAALTFRPQLTPCERVHTSARERASTRPITAPSAGAPIVNLQAPGAPLSVEQGGALSVEKHLAASEPGTRPEPDREPVSGCGAGAETGRPSSSPLSLRRRRERCFRDAHGYWPTEAQLIANDDAMQHIHAGKQGPTANAIATLAALPQKQRTAAARANSLGQLRRGHGS